MRFFFFCSLRICYTGLCTYWSLRCLKNYVHIMKPYRDMTPAKRWFFLSKNRLKTPFFTNRTVTTLVYVGSLRFLADRFVMIFGVSMPNRAERSCVNAKLKNKFKKNPKKPDFWICSITVYCFVQWLRKKANLKRLQLFYSYMQCSQAKKNYFTKKKLILLYF